MVDNPRYNRYLNKHSNAPFDNPNLILFINSPYLATKTRDCQASYASNSLLVYEHFPKISSLQIILIWAGLPLA